MSTKPITDFSEVALAAALFVVRFYKQQGRDAWEVYKVLGRRMQRERQMGRFDATQYNYAAALYSEAINIEFGKRYTYELARD